MDSPGGKGSFKRRQDSFKRRQARLIRMRTLQSGTSSASSAGGAPAAALNHQSSSVINTHTRHKLSSGLTFAIYYCRCWNLRPLLRKIRWPPWGRTCLSRNNLRPSPVCPRWIDSSRIWAILGATRWSSWCCWRPTASPSWSIIS